MFVKSNSKSKDSNLHELKSMLVLHNSCTDMNLFLCIPADMAKNTPETRNSCKEPYLFKIFRVLYKKSTVLLH